MTALFITVVLPGMIVAGLICFRWFRLLVMLILLALAILFFKTAADIHEHYHHVNSAAEMTKNSYLQSFR